jgi:hypothetical protein
MKKRTLITVAKIFLAVFGLSWLIVTIFPACVFIALATYGACVSVNWLAIFVMMFGWSLLISLVAAVVVHWNQRL